MTNKQKAWIGFVLMIVGFLFGVAETIYFGNNMFPINKYELLCDFISLSISGIGCTILIVYWTVALIEKFAEIICDDINKPNDEENND